MDAVTWPIIVIHLTDLHFGPQFDLDQWAGLQVQVIARKPAAIVVTGDLVDHGDLDLLAIAHKELTTLAKKAGAQLVVVPGNHDMGPYGNYRYPVRISAFHYVFIANAVSDRTDVPLFAEHRARGRLSRLLLTLKLNWGLLKFRWHCRGHPIQDIQQSLGESRVPISFCLLDSNSNLRLATGMVSSSSLRAIDREFGLVGRDAARALMPRLAMLHHHLFVPPNAAEWFEGHEGTLLLRNSGTVLSRLANVGIDVVLHGHHHHACFMRVSHFPPGGRDPVRPETDSEMLILGGASACLTSPDKEGNSVSVLRFHRCGMIDFAQVHYQPTGVISIEDRDCTFRTVAPLESVKRKHFGRAVALQGLECDLLERKVLVDSGGTGEIEGIFRGLKTWAGDIQSRRAHVRVLFGGQREIGYKLHPVSRSRGHVLRINTESDGREVAEIAFPHALSSGTGTEDYGIKVSAPNGFLNTEWEASHVQFKDGTDSFATRIRYPTRKLVISLELPEEFIDPRPELVCEAPLSFPSLTVDAETREVDFFGSANGESSEPDRMITTLEKDRLVQVGLHSWKLEIDMPLVGWKYAIKWKVRSPHEGFVSAIEKGLTIEARARLLKTEADSNRSAQVENLLRALLEAVRALFEPEGDPNSYSASFFVFDEKPISSVDKKDHAESKGQDPVAELEMPVKEAVHRTSDSVLKGKVEVGPGAESDPVLRRIARVGFIDPHAPTTLSLSQGITGNAFKRRRMTVYVRPDLVPGDRDRHLLRPTVWSEDARSQLAVVVALPIFRPDARPRISGGLRAPEDTLGVVTIACTSLLTKLLLIPTERGEQMDADLDDLSERLGAKLFSYVGVHSLDKQSDF